MDQNNKKVDNQKRLTISDVANALGVSKSTVSRTLSGNGRISEATRKRILQYIKEHNYTPNFIAKSLAESKTFNIAAVIPGDYNLVDLPFFQECMIGISEYASSQNCDVFMCICYEDDMSQLERIVENHKVDGVILTRTLFDDKKEQYLLEKKVPFATIGTSINKEVIQVDNDHREACKEMTSYLIMKGFRRIGLIGGSETHIVTLNRYRGYEDAHKEHGLSVDKQIVYMNAQNSITIEKYAMELVKQDVDVIVCMDDSICTNVLKVFKKEGIKVPQDIKLASYFNSTMLENRTPSITTLQFNIKELGIEACRALFSRINGDMNCSKIIKKYEVILKESTK